jgi:hypothetical protein
VVDLLGAGEALSATRLGRSGCHRALVSDGRELVEAGRTHRNGPSLHLYAHIYPDIRAGSDSQNRLITNR